MKTGLKPEFLNLIIQIHNSSISKKKHDPLLVLSMFAGDSTCMVASNKKLQLN